MIKVRIGATTGLTFQFICSHGNSRVPQNWHTSLWKKKHIFLR